MIERIQSDLNIGELLVTARSLESWVDGSGARMVQGQGVEIHPLFWRAAQEIADLRNLVAKYTMLNHLDPGVDVPLHQDFIHSKVPKYERWHLVLASNTLCGWWDTYHKVDLIMEAGFWYGPMPYFEHHRVWNHGTTIRTHLVVDLENCGPLGEYNSLEFNMKKEPQL